MSQVQGRTRADRDFVWCSFSCPVGNPGNREFDGDEPEGMACAGGCKEGVWNCMSWVIVRNHFPDKRDRSECQIY
jgi:hypothetical protein